MHPPPPPSPSLPIFGILKSATVGLHFRAQADSGQHQGNSSAGVLFLFNFSAARIGKSYHSSLRRHGVVRIAQFSAILCAHFGLTGLLRTIRGIQADSHRDGCVHALSSGRGRVIFPCAHTIRAMIRAMIREYPLSEGIFARGFISEMNFRFQMH